MKTIITLLTSALLVTFSNAEDKPALNSDMPMLDALVRTSKAMNAADKATEAAWSSALTALKNKAETVKVQVQQAANEAATKAKPQVIKIMEAGAAAHVAEQNLLQAAAKAVETAVK